MAVQLPIPALREKVPVPVRVKSESRDGHYEDCPCCGVGKLPFVNGCSLAICRNCGYKEPCS